MENIDGPWDLVSKEGTLYIQSAKDADGSCIMCNEQYYNSTPVDVEKWHLIAAAPQLYEALEMLMEMAIRFGAPMRYWDKDDLDAYNHATAAIAKAKGKQ